MFGAAAVWWPLAPFIFCEAAPGYSRPEKLEMFIHESQRQK